MDDRDREFLAARSGVSLNRGRRGRARRSEERGVARNAFCLAANWAGNR